MSVRSLVREVTPPLFWNLARQVLGKNSVEPSERNRADDGLPEFEWVGSEDETKPIGYVSKTLVESPVRFFPEMLNVIGGPQPYGCKPGELKSDTTTFWHQQVFPYAYVLGRCLIENRPLKILDWGGGLGLYWHLAKSLYPDLELDYHIHELEEFSRRGPEFTPEAHFHHESDDWDGDRFDLVIASGALQYAPDWRGILKQLAGITAGRMYLARTPILLEKTVPRTILHRPRSYGYETDVLFRALPRSGLLDQVETPELRLVREFIGAEEIVVHPDGMRVPFRGYLLEKV